MSRPKFMTLKELKWNKRMQTNRIAQLKASIECEGATYKHFEYEATLGTQLYNAERNLAATEFYITHWDINNPA